jgi:hypothetical protein
MWHAWEERELNGWFCSENLNGKGLLVMLGRRRKENITLYFKETEFEGYESGSVPVAVCRECTLRPSGSLKCGEFFCLAEKLQGINWLFLVK